MKLIFKFLFLNCILLPVLIANALLTLVFLTCLGIFWLIFVAGPGLTKSAIIHKYFPNKCVCIEHRGQKR